jgi:CheY-like chemotaxis protein
MHMRFGHSGPPKILVVDDEPVIVESMLAILSMEGYIVRGAFSGEEAVAEAPIFEPDLLISDISMYRMNGIEAAALITAMFPACRVLFHSGLALADIAPSIPRGLVYSLVRKPLPVEDLLDCIATLVTPLEIFEPPLAGADDVQADVSAQNEWRWAFNRFPQSDTRGAGTAASCNLPDARTLRLNPPSARDARITIQ